MSDLFFALWFFLPAGIANVTPIFAAHIPILKRLNYPLDFYQKINGKRIFGDHKTIRGLVSGIIVGTLTATLLFHFATNFTTILPSWYFSINPFLLGFLLSFGALSGDAIKSFFKRRVGIQPGKTWIPFDQVDYIVGGSLLSSLIHPLIILQYLLIFALWVGIHILSTHLGFFLHLKTQPL